MVWPARAAALGALIDTVQLHPKAFGHLEKSSDTIGVACSGGADSLAALLLIYHHLPLARPRLVVLHFNHHLRGEDSEKDEQFVRDLASSLDVTYRCANWENRDAELAVSEAKAREARHAFYDAFIREHPGAVIVTGHQRDDVLESLMLKIARSSGLEGLAAPRPIQLFDSGKTMVRPLLTLTKAMLEAGLLECNIPWCRDKTNLDPVFDRNRLRKEVIPAWQQATQFDLSLAAGRVREYLEEADEILNKFLQTAKFPNPQLNPSPLPDRSFPVGALRRWLQHWLVARGLGGRFKQSLFEEILNRLILGETGQWSAGDGVIHLSDSEISITDSPEAVISGFSPCTLPFEGETSLPGGGKLVSKYIQLSDTLLNDLESGKYSESTTVLIDRETLPQQAFTVRPWNPGDRYRPINAPGSRKLQDMFVDRKIPAGERKRLPVVLTADSIIVWCPGLPIGHRFRVTKKTNEILQLTYTFLH